MFTQCHFYKLVQCLFKHLCSRGQHTIVEQCILVHFHLGLPLQQRHAPQNDVDVVETMVEEVPRPFSYLGNTRQAGLISMLCP